MTPTEARALAVPARQAIVGYLAGSTEPATVAELTTHLGLTHNATRKHLLVLVDAGLVCEEREVRTARGRPRLLYRAAARPGGYERVAVILATALATGREPADVAREEAVGALRPGDAVDALVRELAVEGFEPVARRRGRGATIVLGRCPYAEAALANPDAVCGVHRGLAEAATAATGALTVTDLAVRDPRRGGCRLTVGPSTQE